MRDRDAGHRDHQTEQIAALERDLVQLRAVDELRVLRRRGLYRRCRSGDRHLFRQSCSLLIESNHNFGVVSLFHCDCFLHQTVADGRNVQAEFTGGDVCEREAPGFIGSSILWRAAHDYFDFRHWLC